MLAEVQKLLIKPGSWQFSVDHCLGSCLALWIILCPMTPLGLLFWHMHADRWMRHLLRTILITLYTALSPLSFVYIKTNSCCWKLGNYESPHTVLVFAQQVPSISSRIIWRVYAQLVTRNCPWHCHSRVWHCYLHQEATSRQVLSLISDKNTEMIKYFNSIQNVITGYKIWTRRRWQSKFYCKIHLICRQHAFADDQYRVDHGFCDFLVTSAMNQMTCHDDVRE